MLMLSYMKIAVRNTANERCFFTVTTHSNFWLLPMVLLLNLIANATTLNCRLQGFRGT